MVSRYMNITINIAVYLEKDLRHAYGSGSGKGCICGLSKGGRRACWCRRAVVTPDLGELRALVV